MGDYQTDRTWSDKFIPELRTIIGPHLLVPSELEQDRKQAADLVVFTARNVTIACRIRRPGFLEKYRDDFTIRAKRDNGCETELSKIVNGWGDWMFYGHADATESVIEFGYLLDLRAFRAHLIRDGGRKNIKHGDKPNGDGTYFKWFSVSSFMGDPQLVIATHELAIK